MKHSTTHTLIATTEEIRQACDRGQFTCAVYLDLKKAFDTVNHRILLDKLNHYGVRGKENLWFKSFITGRKQFTTISNNIYPLKKIFCMVFHKVLYLDHYFSSYI